MSKLTKILGVGFAIAAITAIAAPVGLSITNQQYISNQNANTITSFEQTEEFIKYREANLKGKSLEEVNTTLEAVLPNEKMSWFQLKNGLGEVVDYAEIVLSSTVYPSSNGEAWLLFEIQPKKDQNYNLSNELFQHGILNLMGFKFGTTNHIKSDYLETIKTIPGLSDVTTVEGLNDLINTSENKKIIESMIVNVEQVDIVSIVASDDTVPFVTITMTNKADSKLDAFTPTLEMPFGILTSDPTLVEDHLSLIRAIPGVAAATDAMTLMVTLLTNGAELKNIFNNKDTFKDFSLVEVGSLVTVADGTEEGTFTLQFMLMPKIPHIFEGIVKLITIENFKVTE